MSTNNDQEGEIIDITRQGNDLLNQITDAIKDCEKFKTKMLTEIGKLDTKIEALAKKLQEIQNQKNLQKPKQNK